MRTITTKYLTTIYFIFLVFTYPAWARIDDIQLKKQGILVFLDDDERDVGAISGDLLTALAQEAGPILVSTALLRNLFFDYQGSLRPESDAKLLEELSDVRAQGDSNGAKYILQRAARFNQNNWTAKAVTDGLALLIPHQFLQSKNLEPGEVAQYDASSGLSDLELRLGLKVHHLETINDIVQYARDYASHFTNARYFVDALKKKMIFCTKADYHKHKAQSAISWAIFMQGHGTYLSSIVGMSLTEFKDVLAMVEKDIFCHLFIYSSCYAAGSNAEALYKENKSLLMKSHSFPIITQAISDTPTLATSPTARLDGHGKLYLDADNLNFRKFLSAAEGDAINFQQALGHLSSKSKLYGDYWANAAQIKLPGVEWFSVLESHKNVVSLGSILASARDPNKPLHISKYFRTDPSVILLYAAKIPFELLLDGKNIDAIISMIPGDAVHTIEKISSPQGNPRSDVIVNAFMTVEGLASAKTFYVKQLNNLTDVVIFNYQEPLASKLQKNAPAISFAVYRMNGTYFMQEPHYQIRELTPHDGRLKKYHSTLNALQGKVSVIESLDFSKNTISNYDRKIPDCDTPCIINDVKANNLSIYALYVGFIDKLKPGVFAWIKNMSAGYHEPTLKIANIEVKDVDNPPVVLLHDVIFEGDGSYFYTYQGHFYDRKGTINYDYRDAYIKKIALGFARADGIHAGQLPSNITPEFREQLAKILEQGLKMQPTETVQQAKPEVNPQTQKQPSVVIKKEMTGAELQAAVDNLSNNERQVCLDFLKAYAHAKSDRAGFIKAVHAMKSHSLMNAILPISYNTPLNMALLDNADYETLVLLLDNHASAQGLDGVISPLEKALRHGNSLKTIQLLLERGAKIDNPNNLLYWTINSLGKARSEQDSLELVRILLKHGANANAYPSENSTLLLDAINNHLPEIASELINHGADVTKKNRWGHTPLQQTVQSIGGSTGGRTIAVENALKLIELMRDKGAKIDPDLPEKSRDRTIKEYLLKHVSE